MTLDSYFFKFQLCACKKTLSTSQNSPLLYSSSSIANVFLQGPQIIPIILASIWCGVPPRKGGGCLQTSFFHEI